MSELLYITFKDTVANFSDNSKKIATENIAAQLLAAADRIRSDPNAIYSYLRQDSTVSINKTENLVVKELIDQLPVPEIAPILTEEEILNIIFKDLKRTEKSLKIVKFLVQNAGTELTADEVSEGTAITKNDLSSWFSMTGNRIPAITRPSRGCFKLNPNNLNITTHGKETS